MATTEMHIEDQVDRALHDFEDRLIYERRRPTVADTLVMVLRWIGRLGASVMLLLAGLGFVIDDPESFLSATTTFGLLAFGLVAWVVPELIASLLTPYRHRGAH